MLRKRLSLLYGWLFDLNYSHHPRHILKHTYKNRNRHYERRDRERRESADPRQTLSINQINQSIKSISQPVNQLNTWTIETESINQSNQLIGHISLSTSQSVNHMDNGDRIYQSVKSPNRSNQSINQSTSQSHGQSISQSNNLSDTINTICSFGRNKTGSF